MRPCSAEIPVNLWETCLCALQSLSPAEKEPMAFPKVYRNSSLSEHSSVLQTQNSEGSALVL